jgi:hypothetical protein
MTGTECSSGRKGELVLVGTGIQYGRHITQRAISEIKHADVVFCLADSLAMSLLAEVRPDMISLAGFYGDGKDRRQTYREMDAAIMTEVRAGRKVCAVFYGHPGVFADVPHVTVRKARSEGHQARMEPGISADACLYADLGIDPGKRGTYSFEATHFLIYDRQIDPCGLLILWQVALCGDLGCSRFDAVPERLELLVEKLKRWYPPETEVILYEACQLPIETFRADRMRLDELPGASYQEYTTLVIPPARELADDVETLAAVQALN